MTSNDRYFYNHCKHTDDEYICSFSVFESGDNIKRYDLYVFQHGKKQEVCIRYGDEPEEYMSMSDIGHFLSISSRLSPVYIKAAQLLLEAGTVTYRKEVML